MKPYYVWDYDLDETQFNDILAGKLIIGSFNQDWAASRLIEYATYKEIIHLIGYAQLVKYWPHWRKGIRSVSRKRGLDFLVNWLPKKHPELCHE